MTLFLCVSDISIINQKYIYFIRLYCYIFNVLVHEIRSYCIYAFEPNDFLQNQTTIARYDLLSNLVNGRCKVRIYVTLFGLIIHVFLYFVSFPKIKVKFFSCFLFFGQIGKISTPDYLLLHL